LEVLAKFKEEKHVPSLLYLSLTRGGALDMLGTAYSYRYAQMPPLNVAIFVQIQK